MNDLDNWLNSLGLDTTMHNAAQNLANYNRDVPPEPEVSSEPFSPDDFNEILAENGFQEPVYEEAEEVVEGNEEEEEHNENIGEGNDLDTEEDENWNNWIRQQEARGIALEEYTWTVRPPVQTEAIDAVAENAITETQPEHSPSLLPQNSLTLLLNDATSRFSGTEWYNEIQKQKVILAGLGGIGSYVSYNLARMNIATLFMYDDDVVEQANMSGQLYCQDDIGKAKVDAMADMITKYTTMKGVYAVKDKFTRNSEAGDVMICGFDNMAARSTFFHSWRKHLRDKSEEEKRKCLYLDGRLSIDTLQVFCITGDNDWAISEYMEKYLFSDTQAEETQCSLKQTTYLACMIGSMIVNLFTNWTANLLNPIIPYDLPFFTEYDAQNMIFKTLK